MNTPPKKSLKILVCYHKPSILIKDDTFIPIHCGRGFLGETNKEGTIRSENKEWLLKNCIGDDTGENISRDNGRFCETTGHFWAWKNYEKLGNPDYIGFMQYRRILVFPEEDQGDPRIYAPYLTKEEYKHYLNPEHLRLGDYDMYVPQWLPVIKFKVGAGEYTWSKKPPEICKVKDQHPGGRGNQEALEYIREHYPEYYEAANDYFEGEKCFQWNMFIFRREIFFEYCQFLFDLMGAVDKKIDFTHVCPADMRCVAYLAEHLTGTFILKKIRDGVKVKFLSMLHIEDVSLSPTLPPAFPTQSVVICCAIDNGNMFMGGVMLNSVITHANKKYNYDIIVLERGVSDTRKKKLLTLTVGHPNVSIRFLNINQVLSEQGVSIADKLFPTSFYYYCIPVILGKYDKVLYLDHNVIAKCDVSVLFNTELGDQLIAACTNDMIPAGINSGREDITYYHDTLGIHDPYTECVSNNVVLFNVRKIRETGKQGEMLDMLKDNDFKKPADDVLNKWAYKKTLFLEPTWNVCPQWIDSHYLPANDYWNWQQRREQAHILSYRGTVSKPWNNTGLDFAADWWRYARSTSFYEEILSINTSARTAAAIKKSLVTPMSSDEIKKIVSQELADKQGTMNIRDIINRTLVEVEGRMADYVKRSFIRDIACLETYRRKLRWYKLCSPFSWGRSKQGNKKRERELEEKIQSIKEFLREER